MLPRPVALLALALLGACALPAPAQQLAQNSPLPEPPAAPAAVFSPPTLDAPPPVPTAPPFGPSSGPGPESQPAFDARPFRPPPGWFVGGDVLLTRPRSSVAALFSDSGELVPDLGLTASPQVTVGYRFERGNAFVASYRYLGSSGDNNGPGFDAHARLDSHWLDLDYRGCLHGPWLWFTFQWQTGCRVAVVDRDVRSESLGGSTDDRTTFVGAGPHFGLDLNWYLAQTGLGLLGRADLGLLFGHGSERTDFHNPSAYGIPDSQDTTSSIAAVLTVRTEAGVSWSPPTQRWLRFECGYQTFDFLGQGHLVTNTGPFVRCEIGF